LKDKKILVTGADGFIGSHLVEALVKDGAKVKALSLYNSFNNWGWLENINCRDKIEIISGDIRDPHFCLEITKDVDIIFHLAALIAIPYSYIAPDSYIDTNIKGTLNICQATLKNGCQRLIHTSTSEVYGTAQYVPIDEKHPLQPQSPYSATKIGADSIAMSFFNSFNLPVIIARPFNTYGPRQSARAVIPTIITQIAAGKKHLKLGDLRPTRDFNYVEDICNGFIALAKSENIIGEIINLGSNHEISIGDLSNLISGLMKSDMKINQENKRTRPSKSEVFRLCCDNAKAKKLINYQPNHTLEQGLEKTIEWYTDAENLKKFKTEIYNV
jgi:NAD dependent epimerase/dehydratase